MEEKMCSGRQQDIAADAERDLWEAVVLAEGVHVEWSSDTLPPEEAFQVADVPEAKISYPWNPLTSEAEDFFATSTASIWDGFAEAEIAHRSQSFFACLDHLWPTVNLQNALASRFAVRVPEALLNTIAQKAQAVFSEAQQAVSEASNLLADQLVQCVRDLAPGLAEEDLYVLVRPLAVQMRNGNAAAAVDSFIAQVPPVEWEQLSDIQRARLGLAIARYALSQLQANSDA